MWWCILSGANTALALGQLALCGGGIIIYIDKEELKTVVRDILACAQPNCHETFITLWNPYRRVSSRGRRAQIRYSRGARGEKPENDRPPFWFYGESIRTSVHGSHIVMLWKRHLEMPSWEVPTMAFLDGHWELT